MKLATDRLILRQWREEDLPTFASLNADPEVMKYFPKPLGREESDKMAQQCQRLISARGWGVWAAELKSSSEFIGFIGLHEPISTLPFSPCIEVAWRLHRPFWGNGYATEAGREALRFAFETLDKKEILSFTTLSNAPSRAVMERLGLTNTQQNFEHPELPAGHTLAEHVLYKITRDEWQASTNSI